MTKIYKKNRNRKGTKYLLSITELDSSKAESLGIILEANKLTAHMKHIRIIPLLLLLSATLRAQTIGQVEYGARIFSTGLPHVGNDHPWSEDFTPPMMTKERRETALECIEWTFGKVVKYEEFYGECCGMHHLWVALESGDWVDFEEGLLSAIELNSPRFTVARELFREGLRVGRKPGEPIPGKVVVEPGKDDASRFYFYDPDHPNDIICLYEVGPDGTIVRIYFGFQEC